MGITLRQTAALAVALLVLQPSDLPARTRVMMCGGCGVVIDADPIFYPRDKAPEGAAAGTIVGAKVDGPKPPEGVANQGLVGRDARNSEGGGDPRGLRLELRMDGGGRRFIEVNEGTRVYRRDRVRVHSDRIEVID